MEEPAKRRKRALRESNPGSVDLQSTALPLGQGPSLTTYSWYIFRFYNKLYFRKLSTRTWPPQELGRPQELGPSYWYRDQPVSVWGSVSAVEECKKTSPSRARFASYDAAFPPPSDLLHRSVLPQQNEWQRSQRKTRL